MSKFRYAGKDKTFAQQFAEGGVVRGIKKTAALGSPVQNNGPPDDPPCITDKDGLTECPPVKA